MSADRIAIREMLVWLSFLIALVPLVWVLYTVIANGIKKLPFSNWWTQDFGSVLSMHREARAAVLAALREVYDGSWT